MQGSRGEGEGEVVADINITPLCDIFVVLLIIFMVTAEQIVQSGPAVDLPANAVSSEQPSRVVVTITEDGRYFVGDVQVPAGDLEARLREEIAREKDASVMIRSDKRKSIREVMRVKEMADRAGTSQVAIGTRLESGNR